MRVEINYYDCPKFADKVCDCTNCLAKLLKGEPCPTCFRVEEDGSKDVVVWIKADDRFSSFAPVAERQPSTTDWLG